MINAKPAGPNSNEAGRQRELVVLWTRAASATPLMQVNHPAPRAAA